jgi:hypothetical protein
MIEINVNILLNRSNHRIENAINKKRNEQETRLKKIEIFIMLLRCLQILTF